MNTPRFHVYKGGNGQWYWRLRAGNGRIVADGEGYTRRHDAVRACNRFKALVDRAVLPA